MNTDVHRRPVNHASLHNAPGPPPLLPGASPPSCVTTQESYMPRACTPGSGGRAVVGSERGEPWACLSPVLLGHRTCRPSAHTEGSDTHRRASASAAALTLYLIMTLLGLLLGHSCPGCFLLLGDRRRPGPFRKAQERLPILAKSLSTLRQQASTVSCGGRRRRP